MQQGAPPGPPARGRPPGPAGPGAPSGGVPVLTGDLRGMPDDDERLWAMFAHGAGVVLPVIGPLLVWFLKQEESEYVAYHAAQALYWGLITLGLGTVILVVTCGAGSVVMPAFWLAGVYVALQANEGSWTAYWLIHPYGYGRKLF